MSKSLGGRRQWLVGAVTGMSLLGACGAPQETAGESTELSAPEATAGDISARLSAGTSSFGAQSEVSVTITLTNVSRRAVSLLSWHTPVDGLKDDLLEVTLNGAPVEYTGRHYKRAAPRAEDFLTLAPGESLTRTVGLSDAYDLSRSGNYAVSFSGSHHAESPALHDSFASNSVSLWIEGRPGRENGYEAQDIRAQGLTTSTNCSTSRKTDITSAFSAAQSMTNNSLSYLTNTTPGSTPRYTTWFGAYSSTGWSTAKSHFTAIKSAFDTKSVVVDCGCTDSAYAYVYPTQPYKIYVCNAFWSAPMTGTDSKGGTLVHEMSHFNAVAGTDDHAYGHTAAKKLATTNPTRALDNADSHEYFAENTPAQN
ncbi:extracellular peptidase. Metallo peptidase. MEROPS family M35 [Stigmatella aurantiaca]|uniref:Extracellular peptidase. Metallo peptidase. MEROPS family M35 n=1 Tax=Stigmatella aurantiaca TaxID=41 RepID=A0A1H7QSB9_STIAU|nr:M35 family metallo-endopeptidase [Stigmatella aurantiaca]SEL50197.1 extracellular peptidase. Metallo peptidase. MEROPS family M35 [Stigmatella aurantiaca]